MAAAGLLLLSQTETATARPPLINNTDSELVVNSSNLQSFTVLPAKLGTIEEAEFVPAEGLDELCDAVNQAQAQVKQANRLAMKLSELISEGSLPFEQLQPLLDEAGSMSRQAMEQYAAIGSRFGAILVVKFPSRLVENTARLRAENPDLSFRSMATSSLQVSTPLAHKMGSEGYLKTLPSILRVSVNGKPLDHQHQEVRLQVDSEDLYAEMELSVVGVCNQMELEDKATFSFPFEVRWNSGDLSVSTLFSPPAIDSP